MFKSKIKKTDYLSYCSNGIVKGCKLCVQGRKLVLFVTGICSRNCFYCPLSEKRKDKDIIWANERKISKNFKIGLRELIQESKENSASGMGITGGDPLENLDRTIYFIKGMKKEFEKNVNDLKNVKDTKNIEDIKDTKNAKKVRGIKEVKNLKKEKFHIHVYLIPETLSREKLKKLFLAGVDEVRFHPSLFKKDIQKDLDKISLAKEFSWDIGLEIPSIPNKFKESMQIIDYLSKNKIISFVNLNELEVSDSNLESFEKMKYKIDKNDYTGYIIKGSKDVALKILKKCNQKFPKLKVHFCTARTKNVFQYKKRLLLRAKKVKTKFDSITPYGDLFRNIIYLENLYPSFNYENKIENISFREKTKLIKILENKRKILEKIGIKKEDLIIDKVNSRFITSKLIINNPKKIEIIKLLKLKPARVIELPTYYSLPLDVEFL